MDKNIIVLNDETPPSNFKFIFKDKIFQNDPVKKSFIPELIISFDAASIDQL